MKTISFTGGRMPPESFPVEGLIEATRSVMGRRGADLTAYPFQNDTQADLITLCARRYEHREHKSIPEGEIIITTGSKQGISLIMFRFTEPGDILLTDETSYTGSIDLFRKFGRVPVGVPMDEDGLCTDRLEAVIEGQRAAGKTPKILYTIPSHHNPTGAVMPLERRRQLLDIVERQNLILLEDDCYGDVVFDSNPVPPALYTLSDSPNIFYLGSYSKILGPGLRLGYLFARDPHHALLRSMKDLTDGGTSSFTCMVVSEYLQDRLWEHITRHNAIIKAKQDLLCATLERELIGVDVRWRQPRGGIFLWIRLPDGIDLPRLEELATQRGVEHTPGREYRPDKAETPYLRLSYAHLSHGEIQTGAAILAECIREACGGGGN